MKKLFTLLALAIILITSAQAPQGFNYQATVRNNSGQLLLNQIVLVKFKILQNSANGTIVYSETQTAKTDDLGQINLVVGQGTAPTGTFSTINWGSGSYYLGIELNTGSGFVAMGTTQLLSVPYALYAEKSGSSATAATNGLNALIKTTDEPAGSNCTSGGTKLEVGLDADKNGVLDDNEVNATQTKYVCNGAQGVAGTQGIQGSAGNFFSSITTIGDVTGARLGSNSIAAEGSWWTTTDAVGWSLGNTPLTGLASPIPNELIYEYQDLNSSKFTLEFRNWMSTCYPTNVTVEFYDANNSMISTFSEETIINKVITRVENTNVAMNNNPVVNYNTSTSNVFNIGGPLPYNYGGLPFHKIMFNTQNIASKVKIKFSSNIPTEFCVPPSGYGPACDCRVNTYSTMQPYSTYVDPGLSWTTYTDFIFQKWQ